MNKLREWSVELTAIAPRPPDDALVACLIESFRGRGPAVSLEADRVSVRFNVKAPSLGTGLRHAVVLLGVRFPDLDVVEAQIETVEALKRRLERPIA